MNRIFLKKNKTGNGAFTLLIGSKEVSKINIKVSGDQLILLNTIVWDGRYRKSITDRLVCKIVDFARMHELKIVPLSSFVHKQFSKNPSSYADVWQRA